MEDCTEYVSKTAAAERLGLGVRRVLELSARGLLERYTCATRSPDAGRRSSWPRTWCGS
jgi:hypothetical protein